ncbi:MAG: DUF4388 domain-containing protein [Acidobacteriota bacterium]
MSTILSGMEQGSFEGAGLPALLLRIWNSRFTGALKFDQPNSMRIITFKDGNLVGLTSDRVEDTIEEFLRASGKLSEDQISAVLDRKPVEEDAGTAFVRSGLLTPREWEGIANAQMVSVIASMLPLSAVGQYRLQPSRIEWEGPAFAAPAVLIDSVMQCEDRHWIAKMLPMDAVLALETIGGDALSTSISYAPEELQPLVQLVDGERTVEEICRNSSQDNFNVCKFLYAMELAGALRRMMPDELSRTVKLPFKAAAAVAAGTSGPSTGAGPAAESREATVQRSISFLANEEEAARTAHRRRHLSLPVLLVILVGALAVVAGVLYWVRGPTLRREPVRTEAPSFFQEPQLPQTQPVPQTQEAAGEELDPLLAAVGSGEIDRAVDISRERLLKAGLNYYTVVLETDCETRSVQTAFENGDSSPSLFVLSTLFKGRKCYNVCWGLYRTSKDARREAGSLPRYFRTQGGHKIVLLADLLVTD